MNDLEKELYKEINQSIFSFINNTINAIKDKDYDMIFTNHEKEYQTLRELQLNENHLAAIDKIMTEMCQGIIHSIFVTFDGGTALSDHGQALEIIEFKTKKPLTSGALHENYTEWTMFPEE